MRKLKIFFSAFLCLSCVLLIVVLDFFRHSITEGKKFIQPSFLKPVLNTYTPKTGDIVMMHYLGHGMIGIPVAEHWPTHAGVIWVRPDGLPVVLECTKFSAPALPNVLNQTIQKKRGVRAVPWADYVNSIDNVLYLRKLVTGSISTYDAQRVVDNWAVHIDFETRIADSMTFDLTIAIGFSPVWPKFSEWCARAAKLNETERRKNQAFCSEFVVQFLQKLGAINQDFEYHYQVSPASLLKSVGILDNLAKNAPLKTSWGDDVMIVRRG